MTLMLSLVGKNGTEWNGMTNIIENSRGRRKVLEKIEGVQNCCDEI